MLKQLFQKYILHISVILLTLVTISGCGNINGSTNNSGPATISGRVVTFDRSTGSSNPIAGASVSLSQIQGDGSLKTVSTQSAQSGTDGSFTLSANVAGFQYLIAIANVNNTQYMGVVDAPAQSGKTIYCSPVNKKSTIDTKILLNTIQLNPNAYVSLDVVRALTSDSLASELSSDTTDIQNVASAFLQRETYRIQMMQSTYINASISQINYLESYQNQYAIILDNNLYNNYGNSDSVKTAYDNFYNSFSNSYNLVNLSNLAYLEITNTSNTILLNSAISLKSSIQFQLNKQKAIFTSYAIRKEMVDQFDTANASTAIMDSVSKANTELFNSFNAAMTANDLTQAYSTYHGQIFSLLKKVYPSDVDSLNAVDHDITVQGGLKTQLDGNLSNHPGSTSIMQAFISYFSSIRTLIQNRFPNASTSKLHSLYSIIEAINLSI